MVSLAARKSKDGHSETVVLKYFRGLNEHGLKHVDRISYS